MKIKFPKGFNAFQRTLVRIVNGIFGMRLFRIDFKIRHSEILQIRKILKKGDILLMGDLRTVYSKLIEDPLTHSGIYIGRKKIVHAETSGVMVSRLRDVLKNYQTLVILRLPKKLRGRKMIIKEALRYAKSKVGLPYNFSFDKDEGSFYCTQLVNEAYKKANYDTGLDTSKMEFDVLSKLKNVFITTLPILYPSSLTRGRFDVVFHTLKLNIKNRKIIVARSF
jgi:hypothetical protein